jgi:glycerol-3-phosphate acyltransferase PlsY
MSDIFALALLVLAYLLGSVCSAIIVCKILGLPDPRTLKAQITQVQPMLCVLAVKKQLLLPWQAICLKACR